MFACNVGILFVALGCNISPATYSRGIQPIESSYESPLVAIFYILSELNFLRMWIILSLQYTNFRYQCGISFTWLMWRHERATSWRWNLSCWKMSISASYPRCTDHLSCVSDAPFFVETGMAGPLTITWLLVWNMAFIFHFIFGMSSFPLTNSYFSEGLKPPSSYFLLN